jgi:hypothetical protein
LSNLLLYGRTADVQAAQTRGLRIGIGPDWSPSGSKNMLGELKVARVYSQLNGNLFTDEEIVSMATRNAASILRWDSLIGTLEPGKLADLLIVRGSKTKPYAALIEAAESDIQLVVIGGVRRYGTSALMKNAALDLESITVAGQTRLLNLQPSHPTAPDDDEPQLPSLTLAQATKLLKDTLANLGTIVPAAPHLMMLNRVLQGGWTLALDEIQDTGTDLRLAAGLPARVAHRGLTRPPPAAAAPAPKPVVLDPLTVADDPGFLKNLKSQKNLPGTLAAKVAKLY